MNDLALDARGLILDIDVVQKTAALRQEYLPPVHATSPSQGSAQLQSDGNMLVGWGANPWYLYLAQPCTHEMMD